jgi:thiamine phosphate synthase YjbQ (UPF0047 family)
MAIFETEIQFESPEKIYVADLTDEINGIISETRTDAGIVYATSLHTTLGLQINEGREPNLLFDLADFARRLVPEADNGRWVLEDPDYGLHFPVAVYRHYCGDNPDLAPGEKEDDHNAARHIRAMLLGKDSVNRIYTDGKTKLGRFQRWLAMEMDGRPNRERRIHVLVDSFDEPVQRLGLRRLAPNAGAQISLATP